MDRSRTPGTLVALVLVGCLTACSPEATPASSPSTAAPATTVTGTADPAPAYDSQSFAPALSVQPPSWLPPQPATDEKHFLTWVGEGADVDRAVRFLSPVGLFDPGRRPRRLGPLPGDYVKYLRGLTRYGAEVSAPTTREVDGHPATILTASTRTGLDGSLGCPSRDRPAAECFGLQEFAVVHLAVIVVDGTTVLAWARVIPGAPYADQDFMAFEEMLDGLRFR